MQPDAQKSGATQLLNHLHPSETATLLFLAVILGLATGIGVWLFRAGIEFFHHLFVTELGHRIFHDVFQSLGIDPAFTIVLVLAIAGLLVGLLVQVFIGHEKYHGVAGIMESVALAGGRLRYDKMPFKTIASMMSLGAGASVGPEDPSVQIGSNLGSFIGARLRLSEERVRLLVASGAASAIAAAFNAPIAGVFFALEVILGEFSTRSFGVVVLSSVIASGFMKAATDARPIFAGISFALGDPSQLLFYAILGIGLAFFSAFAVRFFHWQSDIWHRVIHLPLPLKTMITGIVVGLVGVYLPQIFFEEGEHFMNEVLTGHANAGIQLLLLLGVVKLVMTAISLGGGFVGGVFAPTLFMGIMFGGAYGQLISRFFEFHVVGAPQSYAIAGMAGLLAGIVRAPITAIMLVFEITNDYALILPIMLTSVLCTIIVELLGPAGIYHLSLMKNGVHLQYGRDVDVMQGVSVGEAMKSPAPSIGETATLRELRDAFRHYHSRALCVLDEHNKLTGIVTLGDLQRSFEQAAQDGFPTDDIRVCDICTRDVMTAFADDVLWTAIKNMGARDIGRLPVLKRGTRQVVGLLSRHDIMTAYNMAIARKVQDQHNAEQIRLHSLTGAEVLEYYVKPGSPVDHQMIRDINWPPEAVVASIKRRGKLIVPHGDTELLPNDTLTIVADPEAEILLNALFYQHTPKPTDKRPTTPPD